MTSRQRRQIRPQGQTAPEVRVQLHQRPGSNSVSRGYVMSRRSAVRSPELLTAVSRLDAQTSPSARKELLDWIRAEYVSRGGGDLIGIMSRCYLGLPYVDHTLDLSGLILEHFSPRDSVPAGLAVARPVAQSGAYLYVEVYSDGMVVPVMPDGRSAV